MVTVFKRNKVHVKKHVWRNACLAFDSTVPFVLSQFLEVMHSGRILPRNIVRIQKLDCLVDLVINVSAREEV